MGELLHLGHDIGIVEVSTDKFEDNQFVLDTLEKVRDFDHDMLHPLVKDWVVSKVDGGLVVS